MDSFLLSYLGKPLISIWTTPGNSIRRIMQYLYFWDFLILSSVMSSRLFYVVVMCRLFFFLKAGYTPLYVCMCVCMCVYIYLSIYLSGYTPLYVCMCVCMCVYIYLSIYLSNLSNLSIIYLVYPLICQWRVEWLPPFGYCEFCYEHEYTDISLRIPTFKSFGYISQSVISE